MAATRCNAASARNIACDVALCGQTFRTTETGHLSVRGLKIITATLKLDNN